MKTDKEKIDRVVSEIEAILSKEGIADFIIAGMLDGDPKTFNFIGKGEMNILISKTLEVIFQNDPKGTMKFFSELLKDVSEWFVLNNEKKIVH